MNVCVFDGNIGKDAEVREAGRTEVCTFPLAIRSGWGDNQKTTWVRCQIWGERGSKIVDYLTKGARVTVAGEIHLDEYTDRDGYEQKSLTMDVRDVALPPKSSGKGDDDEEERPRRRKPGPRQDSRQRRIDEDEEEDRPRSRRREEEPQRGKSRAEGRTRRDDPPDHDDDDVRRAESEQDDLDDDVPFR